MKLDTITPTKRTVLLTHLRGRKTKSVSEILNEAAALDEQAALLKAESRERKLQFASLLESGLSAVEASKLLMARPAPAPVAQPKPTLRPIIPTAPTAVPTIAKVITDKVAATITDDLALRAGRVAFPGVSTRERLERELYQRGVEVPGLSVSDTVAQSRGWKRWTLKPREKVAASMNRQVITNAMAELKPVATKPATNTWTKAER